MNEKTYVLDEKIGEIGIVSQVVRGIGPQVSYEEFKENASIDEGKLATKCNYRIFYRDIITGEYRSSGYYTPYGSGTVCNVYESLDKILITLEKKEKEIIETSKNIKQIIEKVKQETLVLPSD